jgi:iron complex outermembrane receptor protein
VVLDPYEVKGYLENYATGNTFTALRVNAPLLEIPLSTSVITSSLILDQGLTDVNAAVRNIAGAQHVQGGSEFQNYYFTRGMPNFYYRDGIRMDLAGGNITPNTAGIETIEVLKGPSSILYGRGTPGGIVNFNSKRPLFQSRQSWQATAGSDDLLRGDVDVTGPAGAQAAYRMIATLEEADSYRDGVSHTTFYVNPSATVNLGADSQLFVVIDHADQEHIPDTGIATRPDGRLPVWATDATTFTRSYNTTSPRTAKVDFDSTRTLAELTHKWSPTHQLRVMASHMRFNHNASEMAMNMLDSAASGVPGMLAPNQLLRVWNSKSGQRELSVLRLESLMKLNQQVGSAQVEHQIMLSFDYGKTDTDMTSAMEDHEIVDLNSGAGVAVWQYFAAFGLGTTKDGQLIFDRGTDRTTDRDTAIAIQDNIKLSESWRLLLGLRYEENQADLESVRSNFVIGSMPAPLATNIRNGATNRRLLPRFGLLYLARPQLAYFCNYLTSFIPAGSTQTGPNGLIAPETGDQIEAGIKYELVSGRLFATASAFKIRREKIATYYLDPTTFAAYWKASDTEESSGFELELTGTVTKGLNLVGHLGYLDNEFTGTDVAAKLGKRRHALSKVTASLWATYAVESTALEGLRLGLGVFHSGQQYLEDYNTVEIGGRTLCDAMVGYGRNRWSVQLNVSNLFDRHYYLPSGNGYNDPGYSAANFNTSVQSVMPGPGVGYQVKLGYTF